MLFYKLQGVCAEAVCGDDRQAKKELTRRIAIATADYNSINSDECFFVSDITDDIVTIGLITKYFVHPVKQVIKKALNYYKMQKLYEEKGVKKDTPAMHMVFSGNPGTAKTTVARLFARIMRENGLLSRGHLVEVGRGDLVGRYVGWTAQTVQAKFKEATGGVLFIDEAYSLVDDRDGSYGDEAINTLVQETENHRADVVVIFAGYPEKMEGFLAKNPGLR